MKPALTANLPAVTETVRRDFEAQDAARERGLALSREVIRESSVAIKHVHRREFDAAVQQIDKTRSLVQQMTEAVRGIADLESAGFVIDACKEFAEAMTTYALVKDGDLPTVEAVGVGSAAYINGLAETVGELRRHALDCLRHGEVERSEWVINTMDDIYYALVSLDYPEAVTQGLRRRTDAARGMIERTRGEVTNALQHERLRNSLEEVRARLDAGTP